jgi:hypothetical protein
LGLIPTPIKPKYRQKVKVTLKTLKLAIEGTGLTQSLELESIAAQPLNVEVIHKIHGFVELQATKDMAL